MTTITNAPQLYCDDSSTDDTVIISNNNQEQKTDQVTTTSSTTAVAATESSLDYEVVLSVRYDDRGGLTVWLDQVLRPIPSFALLRQITESHDAAYGYQLLYGEHTRPFRESMLHLFLAQQSSWMQCTRYTNQYVDVDKQAFNHFIAHPLERRGNAFSGVMRIVCGRGEWDSATQLVPGSDAMLIRGQWQSVSYATPQSVASATPQSVSSATPQSVSSATPQSVSSATPQSVSSATPQSVSSATPQSVSSATPQSVSSATPQSVSSATPQSVSSATPQSVSSATPTTAAVSTTTSPVPATTTGPPVTKTTTTSTAVSRSFKPDDAVETKVHNVDTSPQQQQQANLKPPVVGNVVEATGTIHLPTAALTSGGPVPIAAFTTLPDTGFMSATGSAGSTQLPIVPASSSSSLASLPEIPSLTTTPTTSTSTSTRAFTICGPEVYLAYAIHPTMQTVNWQMAFPTTQPYFGDKTVPNGYDGVIRFAYCPGDGVDWRWPFAWSNLPMTDYETKIVASLSKPLSNQTVYPASDWVKIQRAFGCNVADPQPVMSELWLAWKQNQLLLLPHLRKTHAEFKQLEAQVKADSEFILRLDTGGALDDLGLVHEAVDKMLRALSHFTDKIIYEDIVYGVIVHHYIVKHPPELKALLQSFRCNSSLAQVIQALNKAASTATNVLSVTKENEKEESQAAATNLTSVSKKENKQGNGTEQLSSTFNPHLGCFSTAAKPPSLCPPDFQGAGAHQHQRADILHLGDLPIDDPFVDMRHNTIKSSEATFTASSGLVKTDEIDKDDNVRARHLAANAAKSMIRSIRFLLQMLESKLDNDDPSFTPTVFGKLYKDLIEMADMARHRLCSST